MLSYVKSGTSDSTSLVMLQNLLLIVSLDYCNSLLYKLPKTTLNKLQTVQNTAARIITKTSCASHITPVLKELHWLPVESRVQYKILTLTYKALNGQAPAYLAKIAIRQYRPSRALRSQENALRLVQPMRKTVTYGDRCFYVCAPQLWNSLPGSIRQLDSFTAFKKVLKTHLFIRHYGPQ